MISLEQNSRWVGKDLRVLIEKPIQGGYLARTEGNTRLNLVSDLPGLTGNFAIATISGAQVAHLSGELQKKMQKNEDKSCQAI